MWDIIGELVSGGTTLLLTTQYLDEADRLADRIVVVDAGRVIAEGTSGELKARVGGERLEVTVARGDGLEAAAEVLERYAHGESGIRVDAERGYLGTTVAGGPGLLAAVVRDLDAAGVQADELGLHRPTLDDVFLTLTGRAAEPDAEEGEQRLDEKEIA
jgi:ABC-2 type transport system ATP-binding protein